MNVPKAMQDKYDLVAPIIIDFCGKHLNDEYKDLSLRLLEKLCRKRPSPLLGGKPNTWACGIVYAIGACNFLFDKSQTPHMRASQLAQHFGLSQSTAGNKANEIRNIMKIRQLDPAWTLPSKLGSNPLVWMFEMNNGFIFDARSAPRELQEELFNAGMIPFIPADRDEESPEESLDKSSGGSPDKPLGKKTAETKPVPPNRPERKPPIIEGQLTLDGMDI